MTTTKTKINTQDGNGNNFMRSYGTTSKSRWQYKTMRRTFTGEELPEAVRDEFGIQAEDSGYVGVLIRFDDDCNNGHCTLSVTGDAKWGRVHGGINAGGCIHSLVAAVFPELAAAIPFHLTSTDGPMHYPANPLFLAGDADGSGKRRGEASAWSDAVQFGNNPIKHPLKAKFAEFLRGNSFDLEVIEIQHEQRPGQNYKFAPKFTFGGYADKWHECPFDTLAEALDFLEALQRHSPAFLRIPTAFSEGKARELDGARSTAVWPEATDAELSAPKDELHAALMARLPDLMARFRAVVESLGFDYEFPDGRA